MVDIFDKIVYEFGNCTSLYQGINRWEVVGVGTFFQEVDTTWKFLPINGYLSDVVSAPTPEKIIRKARNINLFGPKHQDSH